MRFKTASHLLYIIKLCFVFLISVIFSGCHPDIEGGLYEGALFRKLNGEAILERTARINIKFDQTYSAKIEVENIRREKLDELFIDWSQQNNSLFLKIPSLIPKPTQLSANGVGRRQKGWQCFRAIAEYNLSACFGKAEFVLTATDHSTQTTVYSLNGKFAPQQMTVPFEEPKPYKLDELINLSLSKNFDTLIEYQRLVEAREAANAAYLNLVPHFDYKDLLSLGGLNPMSIASYVADFVPFLLPTRWIKASEAEDMSYAEEMTFNLIKADVVNQVQGLAYTYEHDRLCDRFYKEFLEEYEPVYEHLLEISKRKIGKIGNNADELVIRLESIINFSKQEMIRLNNALQIDRTALSASIGFQNPLAVEHVDLEEAENSIETAEKLDQNQIVQMALERSLELKQIDYLIHNAELQRKELYFNWADPDVPAHQSISVSLLAHTAKAKAFIKELMMQRLKIQNSVQTQAENATINHNFALDSYRIVKAGIKRLDERNVLLEEDLSSAKKPKKIHTPAGNLQWLLNLEFQFRLKYNDVVANYRIARAKIHRLLLEDYYAPLNPDPNPAPPR